MNSSSKALKIYNPPANNSNNTTKTAKKFAKINIPPPSTIQFIKYKLTYNYALESTANSGFGSYFKRLFWVNFGILPTAQLRMVTEVVEGLNGGSMRSLGCFPIG